MPKFGAHMSISGGVHNAFEQARKTGCDAIQIFTKSNRFWKARVLKDTEIAKFHEELDQSGIGPVVTHASYLINLGSPDDALWEKSMNGLQIELERCETLKIPFLVLHPGAHMKTGVEAGIARVAAALDQVHDALPDHQVKVTLEITAGQGTALGRSFEELAAIRDGVQAPERLAFCFDTCHALATGYEFRTPESYEQMMTKLDQLIGLDQVKVMHINDSKGDLDSHLDRHTHIGEGYIGLEPFGFFINDSRLEHAPFLLETPQEVEIESDRDNLAKLRSLVK